MGSLLDTWGKEDFPSRDLDWTNKSHWNKAHLISLPVYKADDSGGLEEECVLEEEILIVLWY